MTDLVYLLGRMESCSLRQLADARLQGTLQLVACFGLVCGDLREIVSNALKHEREAENKA